MLQKAVVQITQGPNLNLQDTILYATNIVRNLIPVEELYYNEFWNFVNCVVPEAKDYCFISTFGRGFNINNQRFISQNISKGGYVRISIPLKNGEHRLMNLHRLILISFGYNSNYNNLEVNHIDCNKEENNVSNLEWVTRKENAEHAVREGLYLRGTEAPGSIYSDKEIHRICYGLSQRWSHESIAINAGLEYTDSVRSTIVQIKRREIWTHISKDYEFPKEPSYQIFTNDQIHQICKLIDEGYNNYVDILKFFGIDYYSLRSAEREKYAKIVREVMQGKRFPSIAKDYNFYKKLQD